MIRLHPLHDLLLVLPSFLLLSSYLLLLVLLELSVRETLSRVVLVVSSALSDISLDCRDRVLRRKEAENGSSASLQGGSYIGLSRRFGWTHCIRVALSPGVGGSSVDVRHGQKRGNPEMKRTLWLEMVVEA